MKETSQRPVPTIPAVPAVGTHQPHLPADNSGLPLSAALYTSFLCFLFGGNTVAIKLAVTGLGPLTTAGLRFGLGGMALLLWGIITQKTVKLTRQQIRLLFPIPVIFFVQLSFFYLGQSRTLASHGALLSNLLPFVIMLLAHFFIEGDDITPKKVIGLLMGFAAIVLLFFDHSSMGEGASLAGDGMVLCAVILWGINSTYLKKIIHNFSILQVTIYPMLLTSPLFLFCGWLFDGQMIKELNPTVLCALLFQAFITASYGFIAWNTLVNKYGPTTLHSFIFIMPISGVLLGVLMLKEPFTPNVFWAILLVAISLIIINKPSLKKRKPTPKTPLP